MISRIDTNSFPIVVKVNCRQFTNYSAQFQRLKACLRTYPTLLLLLLLKLLRAWVAATHQVPFIRGHYDTLCHSGCSAFVGRRYYTLTSIDAKFTSVTIRFDTKLELFRLRVSRPFISSNVRPTDRLPFTTPINSLFLLFKVVTEFREWFPPPKHAILQAIRSRLDYSSGVGGRKYLIGTDTALRSKAVLRRYRQRLSQAYGQSFLTQPSLKV